MAQWTGKEAIMKKYQISNKELLHILSKREVAYTNIDGILLVDEEKFVGYINALRQAEKQNNAVHRLKQALRYGKKLKLDKTETAIARRLESRVTSIYHVATNTLSMLLEPQERKIFLAFIKGNSIWSVARQTGMKDEEVFHTFEKTIKMLDKQTPYIIQGLVERAQDAEEINRNLAQKLAEYGKWFSHVETEFKKIEIQIAQTRQENDYLKGHTDYLQFMLDSEKRISAGLEEILEEHWKHTKTNYISSILAYVAGFFHSVKS